MVDRRGTDAFAVPEVMAPPDGVVGLRADEAAARLAADGPNRIVPSDDGGRWRRLLGPLADPMVALLLIAAPTYLLIGETVDAIVVFVALVPIAAVGWVLETRAQRTLSQLRRLAAPTAVAERDRVPVKIPAEELVVGDLIWLHEGDVVAADVELVALTQLLIDESTLTGESLPVPKALSGGDERSALAGTTVLAGRAIGRVTGTGSHTRYGQIGALVATARPPSTPLQRALGRLVAVLGVGAAVFCALVVATELARGGGWGSAIIAGVSLAIAAIPEEFSVVYALYLALGAWQLAKDKALVRRLPGVETLGSTTVICTDKTGTLTQGRLSVGAIVAKDGPRHVDRSQTNDQLSLLENALLASEPDPYDPLDLAIVEFAHLRGVDVDAVHAGDLVTDWPFDPLDKYVTHLWRLSDGSTRVASKGSFEGIIRHCRVEEPTIGMFRAAHDEMAADGMRIIAVAGGSIQHFTGDRTSDEQPLELLGLIAFSDPIRDGVADALATCRAAGIRVIMITGDHPATAHAVAEGLALPHGSASGDVIATGDDVDRCTPEELDALVAEANVFARARPDHKHRLVESLRRSGAVVAMTGDGVNDAAALQVADIGVAMGERGTDAAREAATLVLLDDNFATIVTAVRNGRRIYDNLTRAFGYLIAFHPPLMIAALVIPLADKPLLLLPVHLILLELLLHPMVSLVFQADPADLDVMDRPPRSARSGLGVAALWRPYAVGVVLATGIVAAYLVALASGWPVEEARAFGFAILLTSQPLLLAVERTPRAPLWQNGLQPTRPFLIAVTAVVATTILTVYLSPVAALLQHRPFPPQAWLAVLAIATTTTLWSERFKRDHRG